MLAIVLSVYFAFTLLTAGAAKLDDLSHFRATLRATRLLPGHTVHYVSQYIAGFEVIFALVIMVGIAPIEVALVNFILFVGFMMFKVFIFLRKLPPECGCFGATYKAKIDRVSITVSTTQVGLALAYLLLVMNTDAANTELRLITSIIFMSFAAWMIVRLWQRHQYKPLQT